jgi:DNA (cytosine-5)-methyltransferase 1
MRILALDVFCGAGGVTCGLRKAGIRVAVGVDRDEDCRLTFTLNNPAVKFLAQDIRNLSGRTLLSHVTEAREDDFLMLAACAPCQPFSSQNRNRETADDRAVLRHVERLVREIRPDFLFIENVRGLQKVRGHSAFRRLVGTLSTLRYSTKYAIVDSARYGVPQHRLRLVLTASLYGKAPWSEWIHGNEPGLSPFVTVEDAIAKFPPLKAGDTHPLVPNHMAAKLADQNVRRIAATPNDGGSRTTWPSDLRLKCHKSHKGHTDVYGRLRWDSPAPTLTTKCTSLSNGRYGHPEQDRAISVREAAALQSFDDGYVFYGGLQGITRQVGNAVPPRMAEQFGAQFIAHAAGIKNVRRRTLWRSLLTNKRSAAKSKSRT